MKILVTGGGGFLGFTIIKKLIDKGHQVASLSRGRYEKLENLGVTCFQGDIADEDMVVRASQGQDIIIHTAAKAGVWGPYQDYYRSNVIGTENVLKACRQNNIDRLVYTSSPSVVFGGEDQEGIDESTPYPDDFLSAYSKTKAIAEQKIIDANDSSLATVCLRPHLIWGPGDNHIVPRIVSRAKSGRLRLIGGEAKIVDAVYIDNAADAHILAVEKLVPGSDISGRTFFITNHEPWPMDKIINGFLEAANIAPVSKTVSASTALRIGNILEKVYKVLPTKAEPPMTRFVARQLATSHWYNNQNAKNLLGYEPKISMTEGMRRLSESLS